MSSRRVVDALAAPMVLKAEVPCESVCGGGVSEFAFGEGCFDDVADGIDPVSEGCAVVDGGFEGEFHPGAQVGVLGDLMCEGREDRCQLLPCCGARAGGCCFADGFVDGSVPISDEAPCDGFLGREVEVDGALGECSGSEDGIDATGAVSVGVEVLCGY